MYLQDQDYLLPLCRDGIAVGISFVVANAQTSGIGYRYLNNFEGRITLFCNETSEYGMMFEGCRMKLPDIPCLLYTSVLCIYQYDLRLLLQRGSVFSSILP